MLDLTFAQVKQFNRAAAAHLGAARTLLDACPERTSSTRGHEVVYLSGYVVECVLKALLLSRTPRKKHPAELKRLKEELGHNLEQLKNELSQKGVELPREQKENLKRVRPNWSSEMRYDVRRWKREDAERVVAAAEAIFDWVNGG
jgi:HEPN domain-containing protein